MIPFCESQGIGIIPWSPLARGLLGRPAGSTSSRSEADTKTKKWFDDESSDDEDDDSDEESSEEEPEEIPAAQAGMKIQDQTDTNLINLRRTIYLTIMSSMDFEEAGHKLMKIPLTSGQEMEIVTMIIECCSQEKTYLK